MKAKYFKSGLLFAAFAMLFTACDSDRDDNPKLGPNHTASTFVVNESSLADQYIQLSSDNTVNLTWSQPDYGIINGNSWKQASLRATFKSAAKRLPRLSVRLMDLPLRMTM